MKFFPTFVTHARQPQRLSSLELLSFCQTLQTFPHRGSLREISGTHVRVIGFRRCVSVNFIVEYREVLITASTYAGRNWQEDYDVEEAT